LLLESARSRKLRAVPGFMYLAAGFLDPALERNNDGHFGLIVYVNRLHSSDSPLLFLESITCENRRFPVVVREVEERLQRPTVVPAVGWSSCWARTRTNSRHPIGPGALTAQHVVQGVPIGGPVPLSSAGNGSLLDVAPPSVDAALVDTLEPPPASASSIDVNPYVAPLAPVIVQLRETDLTSRVTDVNDTFKIFNSAELPLRLGLEHAGQPGDSGALVLDSEGRAVGIYMGALVNALSMRFGLAQHAFQVSAVMNGMEVFC
jgi:hypothetical protein